LFINPCYKAFKIIVKRYFQDFCRLLFSSLLKTPGTQKNLGITLVTSSGFSDKATVSLTSGGSKAHTGESDTFRCTATGGNPKVTSDMLKIFSKRKGSTSALDVENGKARTMLKEDNQAEFYCKASVPNQATLTVESSKIIYTVTCELILNGTC
jgi:hypothetical protein